MQEGSESVKNGVWPFSLLAVSTSLFRMAVGAPPSLFSSSLFSSSLVSASLFVSSARKTSIPRARTRVATEMMQQMQQQGQPTAYNKGIRKDTTRASERIQQGHPKGYNKGIRKDTTWATESM